jgi:NAD(P)-dependent dehydrogenase (short-subunit alcohol dehydrogenase family)
MDLGLGGKVALVTGAGGSIGAATAQTLALEGARLVVADIDLEAATRTVEAIRAAGGEALAVELDVRHEDSWRAAIETTLGAFDGLDILVNNAGLNSERDAVDETVEGFQRIVDVNEIGVWLGMKHAIPEMRRRGSGAIVNIASISGVVAGFGRAIAYHATKASVRGMSRNSALRFAPDGIRINSVHPGPVMTPMQTKDIGTPIEQQNLDILMIKRFAQPQEIADVVTFVASPRASFMTGAEVFVDGGFTAR